METPISFGTDGWRATLAEELCRVLAANGFDALLPPRDCPTPLAVWTIADRDLAGALVVSASHNPPNYNGVKFFPHDAAPALPEVTDEIMARIAEPRALPEDEQGTIREEDLPAPYAEHVFDLVGVGPDEDGNLDGLEVVYDAMHGSGRGFTDELL